MEAPGVETGGQCAQPMGLPTTLGPSQMAEEDLAQSRTVSHHAHCTHSTHCEQRPHGCLRRSEQPGVGLGLCPSGQSPGWGGKTRGRPPRPWPQPPSGLGSQLGQAQSIWGEPECPCQVSLAFPSPKPQGELLSESNALSICLGWKCLIAI